MAEEITTFTREDFKKAGYRTIAEEGSGYIHNPVTVKGKWHLLSVGTRNVRVRGFSYLGCRNGDLLSGFPHADLGEWHAAVLLDPFSKLALEAGYEVTAVGPTAFYNQVKEIPSGYKLVNAGKTRRRGDKHLVSGVGWLLDNLLHALIRPTDPPVIRKIRERTRAKGQVAPRKELSIPADGAEPSYAGLGWTAVILLLAARLNRTEE